MALVLTRAAQCVKSVVLVSQTITANGSSGNLVPVEDFSGCELTLTTSAVSGTSPTLNFYVQKLLADGSTWDDIISFTQITGNTTRSTSFFSQAASTDHAPNDAALAAGTQQTCSMGHTWRFKWVVAATTPSFTTKLYGDFFK